MKNLFTILLIAPLLTFGQNTVKNTVTELKELNKQIFSEYVLHKNTGPLNEYASEDFILIAAPGMLENKKQVIDGVKNLNISTLNVSADTILTHGNVGIVIGTLEMAGTILGRPVPGKIRYSSTFIKLNEKWQLILRTMTILKM